MQNVLGTGSMVGTGWESWLDLCLCCSLLDDPSLEDSSWQLLHQARAWLQ